MFAELTAAARDRALEYFAAYFHARAEGAWEQPIDRRKACALTRVGVTSIALWNAVPGHGYFRQLTIHSAAVAGHTLSSTEHAPTGAALIDFALDHDEGSLSEQTRNALAAASLLTELQASPESTAGIDPALAREPSLDKQPVRLLWDEESESVRVHYWLMPPVPDEHFREIVALVDAKKAGDCVFHEDGVFLEFTVIDEAAGLDFLQPVADGVAQGGAELSASLRPRFAAR